LKDQLKEKSIKVELNALCSSTFKIEQEEGQGPCGWDFNRAPWSAEGQGQGHQKDGTIEEFQTNGLQKNRLQEATD